MKINYGVNRETTPPKLIHESHSISLSGDWNDNHFHNEIKRQIYQRHPGWSITGYCVAPAELRTHHVWSEGYVCTGQRDGATYHGHVRATSFQDACDYLFSTDKHYDPERLTYWACHLFDNELDARKAFG